MQGSRHETRTKGTRGEVAEVVTPLGIPSVPLIPANACCSAVSCIFHLGKKAPVKEAIRYCRQRSQIGRVDETTTDIKTQLQAKGITGDGGKLNFKSGSASNSNIKRRPAVRRVPFRWGQAREVG